MKSESKTTFNYKRALASFFAAYITVSILATAISIIYEMTYKPPPATAGMSILQAPSFLATVPYHVVIMLLIWPLFAAKYFQKRQQTIKETWRLSITWLLLAMVVDFIAFVMIKHSYSFTPYEFYVLYQPWISLIYIAIFLSPFLRLFILKMIK